MSQPAWQPWQPWHGGGPPQPWGGGPGGPGGPGGGHAAMLASHADRERAVDVLRAGFAEGRLERDEFEKRVARAYAARTLGELGLLVADLPNGPMPHAAPFVALPLPLPQRGTNGKAVGAGVCGMLCVVSFGLTGIPAVILGHSARAEIRRTGEAGDALAVTGLVLGWISTAGWALFLTLLMVAAAVSGS
ncbi:DUF1707 and DUF4190 domain-containing protein [Streptomyces sp. NPDC048002]|uniref:DUF1707 and DUF4190 domain-containing protein n=1 Tax=unclassified Streptomyces TaxID=2593676 RepID=UPI0033F7EF53